MISHALLILATFIATVKATPCLHAPQNPHTFVPSPISCRHYTICMGGNTIVGPDQICPPGLNFDARNQACGNSDCLQCSPYGIQNLPHPQFCEQFIECTLGNRQIRTCPAGHKFDRSIGQCNQEHLVVCGDPWDTTTVDYFTTTVDYFTTTVDYFTTTVDYFTTTWQPITDDWLTTTPSPGNPQLPVCIPGQVYHAHPSDCTKYFMCVNLILWDRECPSNLHWNQRINACDVPERAGCIHGGGDTGDPTLIPPTTPHEDFEDIDGTWDLIEDLVPPQPE